MAKNPQDVIFEGWLTKSPPTKRIWRARWRRRWFLLTHSGELPGQYVLTYYTDRNCRKLKGVIDLDHCEQVDLGLKLDERKLKFDHVFDIKTPSRTYYLAAETEAEMNSWVTCICKVCGLKPTAEEEDSDIPQNTPPDIEIIEEVPEDRQISTFPQTSPVSPVSPSPYIPISECITGKSPVFDPKDLKTLLEYNRKNSFFKYDTNYPHTNDAYEMHRPSMNYVNDIQDPRFYDCPRQLAPPKVEPEKHEEKEGSPLQSPTDSDSVFNDDEWVRHSDLNTSKKSRPSDSSIDGDIISAKQFTKVSSDMAVPAVPPPRPPKPPHIVTPPSYLNLTPTKSKETEERDDQKIITDDMYDFPRSHHIENEPPAKFASLARRHCYNNAAPVSCGDTTVFRYDISPKPSTSTTVFRFDAENTEPASPALSNTSSVAAYSNLPSPLLPPGVDGAVGLAPLMPPPAVDRGLKPRRKASDAHSIGSQGQEPQSPRAAGPCVDRKLKPPTPLQEPHMRKSFNVGDEEPRRVRAAPSPTPPSLGRSHESLLSKTDCEPVYHDLSGKMQYLDLDLDSASGYGQTKSAQPRLSETDTVYKKVDFVATQAFTMTRNNLEKERQEPVTFLKK